MVDLVLLPDSVVADSMTMSSFLRSLQDELEVPPTTVAFSVMVCGVRMTGIFWSLFLSFSKASLLLLPDTELAELIWSF